jgi:hypothetical protein
VIAKGDKELPDDDEPDEIGHAKKAAFLAAYSQLGNLTAAAKASDVHRQRHYEWMKDDPDYPERFKQAHAEACDHLESEARRRAVEGVEKPVFHKGVICGTVQEYSDTLLIFLMKGALPEKYRERMEHSGPGGGAIPLAALGDAGLDDDERIELEELRAIQRSKNAGAICHDGERRAMANGSASSGIEPSAN